MADIIVCPDIYGNKYNEITPHIKLYDAIASGRNVVASDFEVNRALFGEEKYNVSYFSFLQKHSFKNALLSALSTNNHPHQQDLEGLTYSFRTRKYIETYFF